MSHNAFDHYGEPTRSSEPSSWRAFDGGGQVAEAVSPPRSRPRNPYGSGEARESWSGRLMDPPPTAEVPALWPPVPEPSPPRLGAGLRPYSEPRTEESPTLRPGTRFREPSTAENLTVGQRPPSPYREYVTGETPTVSPHSPPPRQRGPHDGPIGRGGSPSRRSFREPVSGEHPTGSHSSPPFSAPPAHPSPPRERFDAPAHPSPPASDRFGPYQPPTAATTAIDRQTYREPATAEAAAVRPGSAPPFQPSPPFSAPPAHPSPPRDRFDAPAHPSPPRPHSAPPDRYDPYRPPTAAQPSESRFDAPPHEPGYGEPAMAATTAIPAASRHDAPPEDYGRPEPSATAGYDSPQRSIQVEPDTGSIDSSRLNRAPADPPWQSRRAAEEDASFISAGRVLGTVGVIVVIIAIAAAVIWGLNLYGDKF